MLWKFRNKQIEYGGGILLMGIVNVTPDSFSDGGEHYSVENAFSHAMRLVKDGADILDIGAQSTRPNATQIGEEEEWARLEDVLRLVRANTDKPISVDTFYPSVAKRSLEAGADIINDVSGCVSEEMAQLVREYHAGWIIMQNGSATPDEVRHFFESSVAKCRDFRIDAAQLCFDVGIGFGKGYDEDMSIIANINRCKLNGFPLLLGASRKRTIGKASEQDIPSERLYGNISADTVAILGGTDIIRLHDVENEKQGILTAYKLKGYVNNG